MSRREMPIDWGFVSGFLGVVFFLGMLVGPGVALDPDLTGWSGAWEVLKDLAWGFVLWIFSYYLSPLGVLLFPATLLLVVVGLVEAFDVSRSLLRSVLRRAGRPGSDETQPGF